MLIHSHGNTTIRDSTITPQAKRPQPAPRDPGAASANGPVIGQQDENSSTSA